MTAFLSTQLDFILFFYGLAFILLGATCIAIARAGSREEAWVVLGLFGFFHGGSEWLDLTAMVVSDSPAFGLARMIAMTTSFVLLMEFARREAIRLGLKVPRLRQRSRPSFPNVCFRLLADIPTVPTDVRLWG